MVHGRAGAKHALHHNTTKTTNMKLSNQVQELGSYIPKHETTNTAVSSATVGWQLAHTFKVILYTINALKKSDPKAFKKKFSLLKMIIMGTGKVPRGKAPAPKMVLPNEEELSIEGIK